MPVSVANFKFLPHASDLKFCNGLNAFWELYINNSI